MRSRSAVTAALALAAATILAVAACGSSVSGSAAVNSTAAETIAATTSTTATTTDVLHPGAQDPMAAGVDVEAPGRGEPNQRQAGFDCQLHRKR